MRPDYGFYVVAIICFIIVALPFTNVIPEEVFKPDYFTSVALTVIFTALGLISIILGYSLRPKPIVSILEAPKQSLPPSPPPARPPTEETAITPPSELVPATLPREEAAKPERKKPKAKTRRKGTRRKRETA